MHSIENVITNRISVRDFEKGSFTSQLASEIITIINQKIKTPFGNTSRFALIDKQEFIEKDKVKLGTYGFIKGANYFVVGVSSKSPRAFIDYGFALEKIILDLTQIKLGTCWLGGTFSRKEFAKTLTLSETEIIPAITPVGFQKPKSLRGKLIRFAAGAKHRKPHEELFFSNDFNAVFTTKNGDLNFALEMLRLAPSAENKQPWRLLFENENTIHFYLKRNDLIKQTIKAVDLQLLDMGIAMCHFEYALKAKNIAGNWVVDPIGLNTGGNIHEYIASWVMN